MRVSPGRRSLAGGIIQTEKEVPRPSLFRSDWAGPRQHRPTERPMGDQTGRLRGACVADEGAPPDGLGDPYGRDDQPTSTLNSRNLGRTLVWSVIVSLP